MWLFRHHSVAHYMYTYIQCDNNKWNEFLALCGGFVFTEPKNVNKFSDTLQQSDLLDMKQEWLQFGFWVYCDWNKI